MAEVEAGHLNRGREELDRAVDLYLSTPGGAYSNPRLGEAYRRTLQAIHVRELEALAAGDGFTERPTEPASIDEIGDIAVSEIPASEEARRTTEEVIKEEANDLPIELNDAVLACIELYQGRLRDWFTAALARGGRYLPYIREVFAFEGIPQDLAYVAMVESAFKAHALSRAKAKGVWQFIPETGRRYGLQQDWWVDERSDPEKSTRAAARYLKALYELLGDWNLVLAGYNAGEGRILRGMQRYGTNDFWKLAQTGILRRETKNYIPLIHAAIVVAKAPEKYGFEIDPESAPSAETVTIEGAYDLRILSECAQVTVDQIQSLNPELRRLATPAHRTFPLKVPSGTATNLRQCLQSLPLEKRVRFRTHVVSRGQTLAAIARRYGTRSRDIADANGIQSGKNLAIGSELIIPIDPHIKTVASHRTSQETPQATDPAKVPMRISYRIKLGDTLVGIASVYGTTVENLRVWNGLRSSRIAAGDILTIFTRRKF